MNLFQKLLKSRRFAALIGAVVTIGISYIANPAEPPPVVISGVAAALNDAVQSAS